jgi:restriction endonuclease S subunit
MRSLYEFSKIRKGVTKNRLEDKNGELYGFYQIAQIEMLMLKQPIELLILHPAKTKSHLLQSGQVLISLTGSRIQAAVVPELEIPTVASNNLAIITLDHTMIDPHYFVAIVRTPIFQKQAQAGITGSVIPHLSLEALQQFRIPVPLIAKQQKIAQGYRSLERYQTAVQAQLLAQWQLLEAETLTVLGENYGDH